MKQKNKYAIIILKITKKDIKEVEAIMDLYSPAVVKRQKKKDNYIKNRKWILKAQKKMK